MNSLPNGFIHSAHKALQHPVFNANPGLSNKTDVLLENALGKLISQFTPNTQVVDTDFTAQAVADRIVNFVTSSITNTTDNEADAKFMLQQAKEGIEQGFSEAGDILSSLGKLTDGIKTQMAETNSLINQGLDKFEQSLSLAPQISPQAKMVSLAGVVSSQFQQHNGASIEIMTQDGDKISVNYSSMIKSASSTQYSTNGQSSFASYESHNESSMSFQFTVQGDIDAGEQQAIDDLLSDIGDLAGRFFSGDVQAAFNSVLELGFDSEELIGFSVDLKQKTKTQFVEAYQYTEQVTNPATVASGPGPAIDVLSQLEDLLTKTKNMALIEQPENTIKSMLMSMLDRSFDMPVQSLIEDVIAQY